MCFSRWKMSSAVESRSSNLFQFDIITTMSQRRESSNLFQAWNKNKNSLFALAMKWNFCHHHFPICPALHRSSLVKLGLVKPCHYIIQLVWKNFQQWARIDFVFSMMSLTCWRIFIFSSSYSVQLRLTMPLSVSIKANIITITTFLEHRSEPSCITADSS